MSNRLLLSFALIALMAMTAAARTIKYVELGVNRSTLRHESCTPGYGISGGLGIDYYPFFKFGGFVGSGLELHNKKMVLKDRIWEMEMDQRDYYFSKGDFDISILFMDVPIRIGYTMKITRHSSLGFYWGYSFAFPLSNYNKIENLKEIKLEKNEHGDYDYDYDRNVGHVEQYEKRCVGIKIIYYNFTFSIALEKALHASQITRGILIKDEIDGFKFMFAYFF